MRFLLTGGQAADISHAKQMLQGVEAKAVIADKGYDSNELVEMIQSNNAIAIIPPRSNRKNPRSYDVDAYRRRNLIERAFGKLKQLRRLATRYDRNDVNFKAFWMLAALSFWTT